MSLEDAILTLARSIPSQQEGTAVREIIRQRDDWQKRFEQERSSKETYERWYKDEYKDKELMGRRVRALRGVITRMKRKAATK